MANSLAPAQVLELDLTCTGGLHGELGGHISRTDGEAETWGSHMSQGGTELAMKLGMALNFWHFSSFFPGDGIAAVSQRIQFVKYYRLKPGLHA